MSTPFKPIEIPSGVVSTATKKMRSSNWSEVNLVRWSEGQLSPIMGQAAYPYTFASRCRRVHSWFDLDGVNHTAYLCEQHLYVDTGGALTDITPTGGITPPPVYSTGYSDGNYSDGTYSDPPAFGIAPTDQLTGAYSLANFGGLLLAMVSWDGRLLSWDPLSAPGTKAALVVAATGKGVVPTGRCFIVTPERFVQVFGAYDATNGGDFRRIAWCDQEDITNWAYTDVTTQAGFIDVEPSSPIDCAVATRTGGVFWTAKKAYVSRYLGLPYVYNYTELADSCTPWSPQSVTTTSSMTVWVSKQGAFSYDGTSILPVRCMVRPWIDDDVDLLAVREQSFATHVADFNEVWWFYPQRSQPFNTRCVIYNYKEGWWSQGAMARSAGITASHTSPTIMANGTKAYKHESGVAYGDADLPWAETFDLNLASGAMLSTVKQMLPDVEGVTRGVRYSLFYRNARANTLDADGNVIAPELQTDRKTIRPDGYVDFRTTGRDIRLRIDLATDVSGVLPVTLGQHLIDSVVRGDR